MYGLYTMYNSVCTTSSLEHVTDQLLQIFKNRVLRQDKDRCYKKLNYYDGKSSITVINDYQISKVPHDMLDRPELAEIHRVLAMGKSELNAEYRLCGGKWPRLTSRYGKQMVILSDYLTQD